STAYNCPAAISITGRLDVLALRRSLNEMVRRHEVLRTCYPAPDGIPRQHLLPPTALPLPLIDLSAASAPLPLARAVAQAEAERPFDLERGPVVRALLVKLGNDDH